MIKEQTIDKLNGLAIVDVVSEYVDLKKAGVNYKGLCPFHDDKNPSFMVSPAKNICHCFVCGKGGNPIHFIMEHEKVDFPEACRILGKNYNIEVEDEKRELTPAEREEQSKKESMAVIYANVQKFFVECLHSGTPDAKAMMDYARHRWSKEEIEERGLGYAPKGSQQFFDLVRKTGLSWELCKEAGLIAVDEDSGREYAFFRDRLTIPVRDRWGNVINYTARTLSEDKDKQKYINGRDSLLFHKSEVLFGLDTAMKTGAREELFYIVEGGPDVIKMQQIGALNTVAPLGTALTKEHLQLLKRFHPKLCFIPDADAPGIAAVMKNGRTAMEQGFRVTVKEIPQTEDGKKQDADSYFQNVHQVRELAEKDFVLWLADKLFGDIEKKSSTETDISDAVKQICDVLILEQDDFTQNALRDALIREHNGHKGLWKNAVNEAKHRRTEEKARATVKKSGIDLMKYGFYEQHNCYWSRDDEGSEKQWSNFKMKPLYHVMGVDDSRRLYEITNIDGTTRILELTAEELVSIAKFMIKVESIGNFIWKATMQELNKLKSYLFDQTETAIRIRQYGWQRSGFWAFGNGCIYDNEWYPADSMGIVHLHEAEKKLDNYYLQGASEIYAADTSYFSFERQFIFPATHSSISFPDVARLMAEVFGDNAKIAICYLLASLHRDIITSYTVNFPILNLFGPKGSGKTELGITLMRFLTIGDKPLNLRNTTGPSLSQMLSMAANSLVLLDEYKNSLDMRIVEIIKGAYDGVGRARMDMDRGKQIERTPVDCGVMVCGQEMPTLDIAMFTRMIYLPTAITVHDREAKDKFNHLSDIRKLGLQHLTMQILAHRANFESAFYDTYNEVTNEVCDLIDGDSVEDRLWRNWAIMLTTYKVLRVPLGLPFPYEEIRKLCVEGIKRQNGEVTSNNELGNLWNALSTLYDQGKVFADSDFKVKYMQRINTDKGKREYKEKHPILMLRLANFVSQYKQLAQREGEKKIIMDRDSIRYYLTTGSAYLGAKPSERYVAVKDGVPETIQEHAKDSAGRPMYDNLNNPVMKAVPAYKFDRFLCFDYEMLKSRYGLRLERFSALDAERMEREEEEEENAPEYREGEIF
jgi:DNA primase catalytic core